MKCKRLNEVIRLSSQPGKKEPDLNLFGIFAVTGERVRF